MWRKDKYYVLHGMTLNWWFTDVGIALALELSHDGGSYHAAVSGYIDLTVLFHISS